VESGADRFLEEITLCSKLTSSGYSKDIHSKDKELKCRLACRQEGRSF
jgi:hypothetical protein